MLPRNSCRNCFRRWGRGEKEKRKEAGNRMMRGGDCRTSGPCVLRAMGSVVITYNLSDFIPQMFISHPTNIGADQKVFSSIWQIQDPAIIAWCHYINVRSLYCCNKKGRNGEPTGGCLLNSTWQWHVLLSKMQSYGPRSWGSGRHKQASITYRACKIFLPQSPTAASKRTAI